ncbi:NHLP leader peptide family natural product precursor [Pannonibacter phragmitetus]|uniref:NHLP leader peptide family natural product precursor n=1 Tax=Pannonibacter phragmitetus TaxID=121719 RepID=UPI003D2ED0C1
MSEVKSQLQAIAAAKADEDASFREALTADPAAALGKLLGVDGFGGLSIRVIEEKAGEAILVLPPAVDDGALTDDQLARVSAGRGVSDNLASLLAVLNAFVRFQSVRP